MNLAQFKKLIGEVDKLTDQQSRYLESRLQGDDPVARIVIELEQRLVDKPECPHCHSSIINRHGKVDNMQRYRCKNCNKTFMATTDIPFARLRHK